MQYDIIHIAGKPHVLVPLHDYTQLKNGGAANDLPDEVLQKIEVGAQSPIITHNSHILHICQH